MLTIISKLMTSESNDYTNNDEIALQAWEYFADKTPMNSHLT